MLTRYKPFGAFNRAQKPLRFVRVNSVLNIFAVRKQFKIIQPIICAIQILMVNLHTIRDGAIKRFPHRTVNSDLSVFPVFARAKPDVMVVRYVRLNWARFTIAHPRLAVFNIKRGRDASVEKTGYGVQRPAARKHSFGLVNLRGAKKFSSCYAANARKIAYFIQAFITANRFPNLHAVDIKPIYVGGQ